MRKSLPICLVALACVGAAGCNMLLNIENSPLVESEGGSGDAASRAEESDADGFIDRDSSEPQSSFDSGASACDDTMTDGACWTCNPGCSPLCSSSNCLLASEYGAYATTGTGVGLTPIVEIYGLDDGGLAQLGGVQIYVDRPGVLVQFGMLAAFGGPAGYLGLYADDGGQPGALLAWTREFQLVGNSSFSIPQPTIVDVVHPVPLEATHYWILGIFRSDAYFSTQMGNPPACDVGCVHWYQYQVSYSLPDSAAPEENMKLEAQPILYATLISK